MSLFVRVNTAFFKHRKTIRLKAALGNDALWLPPRLWAYCATNCPEGNLDGYTAPELADALDYTGDATRMLEAMLQAGFLDPEPLRVHGWAEHNGYHKAYAERAKKGAAARWAPKPPLPQTPTQRREERRGEEASIASSMLQASGAGNAPSLPRATPVSLSLAPTWEEFIGYVRKVNAKVDENFVEAKWLAKQEVAWEGIKNWKAYAERVIGWWVRDGKPSPKAPEQESTPKEMWG